AHPLGHRVAYLSPEPRTPGKKGVERRLGEDIDERARMVQQQVQVYDAVEVGDPDPWWSSRGGEDAVRKVLEPEAGHRRARDRAMTMRWIWLVPSTICSTFASRR